MEDVKDIYDKIGNLLANFAPESWKKIVLSADLRDYGVITSIHAWMDEDGKDVRSLEGLPPRLAPAILELAPLLSTEEKGYFKNMKFSMSRNRKFKVEYDYKNFQSALSKNL